MAFDLNERRTSLWGRPLGGDRGHRWNIRHFAWTAPKLDAKLALKLHRFSNCFGVVIRRDDLHCDRKLVHTDYEGPVRNRLGFPGGAKRSLYSA
jgi:hypothetical protein